MGWDKNLFFSINQLINDNNMLHDTMVGGTDVNEIVALDTQVRMQLKYFSSFWMTVFWE